jgi:hypothetical protein
VVKETDKFEKIIWLPHDEIPKRLPPVIRNALEKIAVEKIYAQFPKEKDKKKAKFRKSKPVKKKVLLELV